MLDGRLVTVFGGGGFLGRYIVQNLLKRGARVRIAERDPRRAYFLRPLGALGQTQFVAADVTRPETLEPALRGSDAAVNLVGTFGAGMEDVHVGGARAVAVAARAAGAGALVHLSAVGADPAAISDYGRTKGEGEAAVRDAFASATILRPSMVFGREDQFVNRFARMIRIAPVVPVLRPGARFQPVFVGDVAAAASAAIAAPERLGGQTLELGGPDVLTMRQLLEWIAARTGRKGRFVDLPDAAAALLARLPGSPISRDQWLMLQQDNVVTGANGLAEAGVPPTPLDAVAAGWLVQYRRQGRFAKRVAT